MGRNILDWGEAMLTTDSKTTEDLHPDWCTLTDDCADPKNQRHEGRGARWPAQEDDAELTLAEVRIDELAPRTGQRLVRRTRYRLGVLNTALINRDGSPVYADVCLTEVDLDILLGLLLRARRRLDRPDLDLTRTELEADCEGQR